MSAGRYSTQREECNRNEANYQSAAHWHDHRATSIEQLAQERIEENRNLQARCEEITSHSQEATERALQERLGELQHYRRELSNRIGETNGRIEHTSHVILQTQDELESLEAPLLNNHSRETWRHRKPGWREQFADPVSAELEDQQRCLGHTAEALRKHGEAERHALGALYSNKDHLELDHKNKTSALQIDQLCLSHKCPPTSSLAESMKRPNSKTLART